MNIIKYFFVIFVIFGITSILGGLRVEAQPILTVDPLCTEYETKKDPNLAIHAEPHCNFLCSISCINTHKSCSYGSEVDCALDLNDPATIEALYPDVWEAQRETNFFDLRLCPAGSPGPLDDPFCLTNIIRLGILGFLTIVIGVSIGVGVYAAYVRSTALDVPEKYQQATKLMMDAFWGVLIALGAVLVVQIIAMLLGITGGLFSISIVPFASYCNPDGAVVTATKPCCSPGTHVDGLNTVCGTI